MARKKKTRYFLDGVQPQVYMGRSKFDLSYSYKTSLNVGSLIPMYIQEAYPGDTLKVESTFVCRTLSPYIRPVMDSLFIDCYYFFVPNRLVWTRWQELMGENVNGAWKASNLGTLEVPKVRLPLSDPDGGPAIGIDTIANYFGINIGDGLPVGSSEQAADISDLPFRAFALIYNEWFRNENFEQPVFIETGDYSTVQRLNNNDWSLSNIHGKVPRVNKLADYFTSCLPEPQKGDAVDIPISDSPVIALQGSKTLTNDILNNSPYRTQVEPLSFSAIEDSGWASFSGSGQLALTSGFVGSRGTGYSDTNALTPNNLWALNSLGVGNINDLRFAFQLQKMLEKDARGGTRYVEYLRSHFGVQSPDARLQRPEFLGGKRIPLQMQEVAQTSQSSEESPLAQLSAYSTTVGRNGFSKGVVEHGFFIGVGVIRQRHTYQQGIERFWRRFSRYDFYDPVFANIGEQPVYRHEIYAESLTEQQAEVPFGYNEAWADLRYRPGKITGILNSTSNSGFDIWHFGDYYESTPFLNTQWMKETPEYVDRTLSADSSQAPQFIIDFYHKARCARVMPLYSIPGLVDHH